MSERDETSEGGEKPSRSIEITRVSSSPENQGRAGRPFDPYFDAFDALGSSDNEFDHKLWDNGS
jgi:hypothetical protein